MNIYEKVDEIVEEYNIIKQKRNNKKCFLNKLCKLIKNKTKQRGELDNRLI